MRFTNPDNSHIPIPGFYSKTVPSFGLAPVGGFRGGSNCVQKCVTDCEGNCGSYCKLASTDTDVHNAHLKDLKETVDKLQVELARKSSDFLKSVRRKKTSHSRTLNHTRTRTPRYNIVQLGGYKKSKKRLRKTRKGGISFWGSTTELKPCENSCKKECPYQCKTICDRAARDTSTEEDKKEINDLNAQIQHLRNAIIMYS
jgi:hypothetical protein